MVSDAGAAVTLLRTLPLSAGISDDELLTVAGRLRPGVFAAGESIVREGETGDAWYVVRDGRAAVVSRDLVGLEVTLAVLESGAHFGEGALVGGGLRSATVKALDPVRVYVLNRNDFHELEARCPEFSTKVRRHVDLLAVDSFLRKASPFAHLPDETIRRVAGQLRPEPARSGQIIVQEGEPGDRFYLVWSGRVEVIQKGQRVQVLDAGNCFGEVALLAEVPRTATVRALEDTRLLSLSKSDFEEVVQESAVLQRQFTEFVRIRAGNALARTLAVADPLNALMPDLGGHRRGRYWQFLVGGLALFGALTLLASRTQITGLVYAALLVGSFLGPLVYVAYLAESHLLTERPFRLGVTFVLAAGLGIPVAATIEGMIGAHRGTFMSALMIGVVEEPAKALGVTWLLLRSRSRFQMDGLVYGAAAGMGFAAFENLLYGWSASASVSDLLSTLWIRTILSPFGHGTWTAIICAAIWRAKGAGRPRLDLTVAAAFGFSILLHGLWDWQPVDGPLLIGWFIAIGVVGLEVLRTIVERANRETTAAVLALNPTASEGASSVGPHLICGACGQAAPAGTHYCARCGAALRA